MATKHSHVSLLSLPDELLCAIIDEVAGEQRQLQPLRDLTVVCRRLGRLAETVLYRNVEDYYGGPQGSDVLIAEERTLSHVLKRRTDLWPHVRSLRLSLRPIQTGAVGIFGKLSSSSVEKKVADILTFLRYPNLTSLTLTEILPQVLDRFIEEAVAQQRLRILKSLNVCQDAYLPRSGSLERFWVALAALDGLEQLTLDGHEPVTFPTQHESLPPLLHLQELNMNGGSATSVSVPNLAAHVPNLRTLRLFDGFTPQTLEEILKSAPTGLSELYIRAELSSGPTERCLGRFPHLEELTLCPGFSPPDMLDLLQTSQIRSLSFGYDCAASDDFLLGLIEGPRRMKHLRSLTLDHIEPVAIGENLYDRLSSCLEDATKDDIHELVAILRPRFAPEWPPGSDANGMRAVLTAAAANGITVLGEACVCLQYDRDFDAQLGRVLADLAIFDDNYEVLVGFYGAQKAARVMRAARPALAALMAEGTESSYDEAADGETIPGG